MQRKVQTEYIIKANLISFVVPIIIASRYHMDCFKGPKQVGGTLLRSHTAHVDFGESLKVRYLVAYSFP